MVEWKERLRATRRKKRALQNQEAMSWIARFPLLAVDLHDWLFPGQGRSLPFLRQISQYNRDFVYLGENVFSIANPFE